MIQISTVRVGLLVLAIGGCISLPGQNAASGARTTSAAPAAGQPSCSDFKAEMQQRMRDVQGLFDGQKYEEARTKISEVGERLKVSAAACPSEAVYMQSPDAALFASLKMIVDELRLWLEGKDSQTIQIHSAAKFYQMKTRPADPAWLRLFADYTARCDGWSIAVSKYARAAEHARNRRPCDEQLAGIKAPLRATWETRLDSELPPPPTDIISQRLRAVEKECRNQKWFLLYNEMITDDLRGNLAQGRCLEAKSDMAVLRSFAKNDEYRSQSPPEDLALFDQRFSEGEKAFLSSKCNQQ